LVEHIADNKLRHKIENLDWSQILKEDVSLKLPKTGILLPLYAKLNANRVAF